MTMQKSIPQIIRRAFRPAATRLRPAVRRCLPPLLLGVISLTQTASAQMISNVVVGPAGAPYAYNLTVEFANGHYYDFTLRSAAPTLMGDTLINTIATFPEAHLTVDQQFFSGIGYYVNGITVGSDTTGGYNPATGQFWSYWNGTATTPVQWTSPQTFGESDRTITPGQADGWVYSTGTVQPQATTFAVPEPGTWALLTLAGGGLLAGTVLRRRERAS